MEDPLPERNEVVYDPTEVQLRDLNGLLDAAKLTVESIAGNSGAIQLLLRQQTVQLHELGATKRDLAEANQDLETMRGEREILRIHVTKLESRADISFIQIPISIASGFAINVLTADIKSPHGWLLLGFTSFLLLFLRKNDIADIYHALKKENSK